MHRRYLDDGVFIRSVVEVEGLLAASQQALPPMGLELLMRKTAVWGSGLVPAASPPAAATHLHLQEGTEVLAVPIQSTSMPLRCRPTWESWVRNLHTRARRSGAWQTRSPRMRSCGTVSCPRLYSPPCAACHSATRWHSRKVSR